MAQVEYINQGDAARMVRIINDDGTVEYYELNTAYPEHVALIIQLDQQANLRASIESLYVEPAPTPE